MNINNLLPKDGEAYFFPRVFDEKKSISYFETLKNQILWKQEPIKIMGKEILQPRLTAWYADQGITYSYSGIKMLPAHWNYELLEIKQLIETLSGETFNSALLNLYRDENDSMGWHRDNEKSLGINPVIASVSFGAARTFSLKHKEDKKHTSKLILTSGSLLLMKGDTQHYWYHCVPKEKAVSEPRINITFRRIKS